MKIIFDTENKTIKIPCNVSAVDFLAWLDQNVRYWKEYEFVFSTNEYLQTYRTTITDGTIGTYKDIQE